MRRVGIYVCSESCLGRGGIILRLLSQEALPPSDIVLGFGCFHGVLLEPLRDGEAAVDFERDAVKRVLAVFFASARMDNAHTLSTGEWIDDMDPVALFELIRIGWPKELRSRHGRTIR